MTLIDTNVIIRFLLNDIPEQSQIAKEVIEDKAWTTSNAIQEACYTLTGYYQLSHHDTATQLLQLLKVVYVEDETTVTAALELFDKTSFDYLDCVLITRALHDNVEVFTFDKKLAKYIQNHRED